MKSQAEKAFRYALNECTSYIFVLILSLCAANPHCDGEYHAYTVEQSFTNSLQAEIKPQQTQKTLS